MSQSESILYYMAFRGAISTFEAFSFLHCTKLTTRVSELRKQGYHIADRFVTKKNADGNSSTYKEYWLADEKDVKELQLRYGKELKA